MIVDLKNKEGNAHRFSLSSITEERKRERKREQERKKEGARILCTGYLLSIVKIKKEIERLR